MPPEDSLYLFQASCFYGKFHELLRIVLDSINQINCFCTVFLGLTNNRLQAYCKHNLEHNIHVQNVLQILEASDKMNVPDIKKFALSMIVRDFAQVARLPKMRNLNRHLLLEIIEAMGDVVSELNPNNDLSSGVHSDI